MRVYVALNTRLENDTSIIYTSKDRYNVIAFCEATAKKNETLSEVAAKETKFIMFNKKNIFSLSKTQRHLVLY